MSKKDMIFAKGKDGHYRYMTKKEYGHKHAGFKLFTLFFYLLIFAVFGGIGYYIYTDIYDVYLVEEEMNMAMGSSYQIELLPKNANYFNYDNYIYDTDNKNVATVDRLGGITARGAGTTTLTVKFKHGFEKKSMVINVSDLIIESLETEKTITISKNSTTKVNVKVNNQENVSAHLSYKSSNENVFVVDGLGNITGKDEGEAILTVSAQDGIKSESKVIVKAENTEIQELAIKEYNLELRKGAKKRLTLLTVPNNASIKGVTWSSSDSSIVSVDNSGNIKALTVGSATISAKTKNGLKANSVVNVYEGNEIVLSTYSEELEVGKSITITSSIDGYWSSDNTSVAIVDQYGRVSARSEGTANITVKAYDKENSALIKVVKSKIDIREITIEEDEINIYKGEKVTIKPNVVPSNATNKKLTWTSSNTNVASVNSNGEVKGLNSGKSTITVKTSNGLTSSVEVNVFVKNIEAKSVSINVDKVNISIGDTYKLIATVLPKEAINKDVTWTSSNNSVVTVNEDGIIRGISKGTATITAKSDNGKTATCSVNVKEIKIPVTGVSLNTTSSTLKIGQKLQLKATIRPSDASVKTVSWSSDNTSVAKVDSNGVVTALSTGTATISVTTVDSNKTAQCIITVKQIDASSISINEGNIELKVKGTKKLTTTINPSDTTDKSVTWTSGDSSVASVDSNGKVTAKKVGTTTISVKTTNNKTDSIVVTVKDILPTKLKITEGNIELRQGSTKTLTLTYTPSNVTDKSVTWSSSNSSVASVNQDGKVTAIKEGSARIIVTAKNDTSVKAEIAVNVTPKNVSATSITLNKSSLSMFTGTTATLEATINPSNTTDKSLTWTSSNKAVATVNSSGKITAKTAGNTTITVTTSNGKKATCSISVSDPVIDVTKLEIQSDTNVVYIGESINLSVKITPSNATNKKVTWSSNKKAVATVDSNGKVIGKSEGSVTITAESQSNPNVKTTKNIVVKKKPIPVTEITLNKENATMYVGKTLQLTATVIPSNATVKTVTWRSTSSSVAKVNSNGLVTALKQGSTYIEAVSSDGSVKARCNVTVKPVIDAESVSLNVSSKDISKGKTYQLTATITPDNATYKTLTWSSNNTNVASVDKNGLVTAKEIGTAIITVKTTNGKTSTCTINVKEAPTQATSIKLNTTNVLLKVGGTSQLSVTFNPSNTTDKTVTWTSSNTKIATVSSSGKITAVKQGAATITATSSNGKTASTNVIVYQYQIIDKYESSTLKYYIERPDNPYSQVSIPNALKPTEQRYILYRIWVKDAYNQMKTVHSRIVTGKARSFPMVLVSKEVEKYGYAQKGMVSVNASGFGFSTGKYGNIAASYVLNAGNNGSRVTYDASTGTQSYQNIGPSAGIVLYDAPTGTQRVMGLTKNSLMKSYGFNKDVANNNELKTTITNDGVKYTFNFSGPIMIKKENGQMVPSSTDTSLNPRTAFCQIDKHNFIILSTTMTPGTNNNQAGDNFRYNHGLSKNTLGAIFVNNDCIWGANLDGGGSVSQVYKKNDTTYYRYYDDYGKVTVYPNTATTYGYEREVTDQLYFVEQ